MWVRLVVRITGPRTGPSSANQRLLAVGVLDFLSPIETLAPPWVFLLKERVVVLGFGFFASFSHGFCWSRCLCCITQSFRFSSRVWLRFSFHAGLLLWCGGALPACARSSLAVFVPYAASGRRSHADVSSHSCRTDEGSPKESGLQFRLAGL